jgi:CDP-diacylglycerol--serine O-phosphatidyltransferase
VRLFKVRKYLYIPSFFTLLNFFWGFLAIVKIYEGNLYTAAWFIILAVLSDGMDGKLARWTGSETRFGTELDSLADVLSTGIAPAFLIYADVLNKLSVIGLLLCFLYVIAGAYRLARFNVQQAGNRSQGYVGLPIPVAGMTIAAFWLFKNYFDIDMGSVVPLVLVFLIALMMVSTIHYDWPKLHFQNGWMKGIQSAGLLIAVLIMAVQPQISLFPLLTLYIVLGFVHWVIALAKGETQLSELFIPIK